MSYRGIFLTFAIQDWSFPHELFPARYIGILISFSYVRIHRLLIFAMERISKYRAHTVIALHKRWLGAPTGGRPEGGTMALCNPRLIARLNEVRTRQP
jgi:hypothetical protein